MKKWLVFSRFSPHAELNPALADWQVEDSRAWKVGTSHREKPFDTLEQAEEYADRTNPYRPGVIEHKFIEVELPD